MADLRARLDSGLSGRYTIERELGRGGMATVYLASDLKHDRSVAIKLLHPDIASSLGAERFQREIKLAARLQHPHILGVHDSGVIPGEAGEPIAYWFTMPYVEGESLRERMQREGQLPFDDAVRIASEAADALDYAHQRGVVHRDIKPENILLSGSHALVADFGIARALHGEGGAGEPRLTGTGLAVGTPAYMSPEQAAGEARIDARTDVYALGAVLYEMLTGEPPFTGPTAQAVIARMLTEAPRPVRSTRQQVPASVDAAIARALARAPADRWATTGEFARAVSQGAEEFRRSGETVVTAVRPGARRAPRVAAMFGLGLVIGLGVLFAWSRADSAADNDSARVIAVLPFENQGASEDKYFADGMTDEVRGRLASVPGLTVIARGSSSQYQGSSKTPAEIARELGAQYLLTATVRWEKSGGQSRVRVTPELVEVRAGAAPSTRWQQPFDAVMSDVFKVQADIAGQVAQALDVELAAGQKEKLEVRPTANLAAYDAYLQGNEAFAGGSPPDLQRASGFYGRAAALDSTFVLAWSQLSRAYSLLYWLASPLASYKATARAAAEKAVALDPNAAAAHLALGDLYRFVETDWNRAIEQYNLARRADPQNADILSQIAFSQQGAGLWEEARATLEEGAKLDPRSVSVAQRLSRTHLWLRRYQESLRATERLTPLAPNSPQPYQGKVMTFLAMGNLEEARKALRSVPRTVDPTELVSYFGNYWDLYWILDEEQQQLLLRLPPGPFGDDRSAWGVVLAQTYYLRGDLARARIYADSARLDGELLLKDSPNDDQRHVFLGLSHAILGNKAEAIRYGERAIEITPMTRDAYTGVYLKYLLARIYMMVGEGDRAIDQLESILRVPFYVSPGWLRVDPEWDPLRSNPRFQRLTSGS